MSFAQSWLKNPLWKLVVFAVQVGAFHVSAFLVRALSKKPVHNFQTSHGPRSSGSLHKWFTRPEKEEKVVHFRLFYEQTENNFFFLG